MEWYESHTTLVDVARLAVAAGTLTDPDEIVDFFETPWSYPEYYEDLVEYNEKYIKHNA